MRISIIGVLPVNHGLYVSVVHPGGIRDGAKEAIGRGRGFRPVSDLRELELHVPTIVLYRIRVKPYFTVSAHRVNPT